MQFEPAMWHAYGLGGNVDDPHDAIIGAANYLAANRGAKDERNALAHYTPRLSTATPFSATQTGSRAIATRSTSTTAGRSTSGHEAEPTDSPDLADSSPPPTARARM
jgi:membrane-bound lytic murein transglycosylase B